MKTTKYKVIYTNGNERSFDAFGFTEAIIKAMSYAIEYAWDYRIKYIIDEKGTQIQNIKEPSFNFTK